MTIEALLQPFCGYLELGMFEDAKAELENLPAEFKTHPTVSLALLSLHLETKHWEEGVSLGKSGCQAWPGHFEFWFKTAYCLHELKRTQEAKDTLLNAPAPIRKIAVYHYNMACYEAQLGNLEAAKRLLKTCFAKDKSFRKEALSDPDLQPLYPWLERDSAGSFSF